MSELPEIFKFKFDPKASDEPVFKSDIGLILWSCIKIGHITCQHFNNDVLSVVKEIEKRKPKSYSEFRDIIKVSKLQNFGTKSNGDSYKYIPILDDSYWLQVWEYVNGDKKQKIDIDIQPQNFMLHQPNVAAKVFCGLQVVALAGLRYRGVAVPSLVIRQTALY